MGSPTQGPLQPAVGVGGLRFHLKASLGMKPFWLTHGFLAGPFLRGLSSWLAFSREGPSLVPCDMSLSTRLLSMWQLLASSARAREGQEMEARVFLQPYLQGLRRGPLITFAVFYCLEVSHRPTHTPAPGITWGVTTSRESSLISWKPTQRVGVKMGE